MGEFDFIADCLAPLAGPQGLGLLDDAALYTPAAGRDLVLTKDTMVEGVHFPSGHWGADTAEKLLRVNLSDLAAKGATPRGYLLSLSLPEGFDMKWGKAFALGLKAMQDEFGFSLWGGDTTSTPGPLTVSATLIGSVPSGRMVTRSGAKPGDSVFVSGSVGDAVLGLDVALNRKISAASGEALWAWENAYYRPQPRLDLRHLLRAHASAALDVSDGLIADAGHLAKASGNGLSINVDDVPLRAATRLWLAAQVDRKAALSRLLTGGDDYEILFTASDENTVVAAAKDAGVSVTVIGKVTDGQGVTCTGRDGTVWTFDRPGYRHFRTIAPRQPRP